MLLGIRWGSLRTKIIAWYFVPTAIILVAVAVLTYFIYQHVTEDLVTQRDQELTRLSAGQLAAQTTRHTDILAEVAHRAAIYRHYPSTLQGIALTEARNRLAPFDGGVVILDKQGQVIAAEPDRPALVGQDWSDRPYFSQAKQAQAPASSNILADGPGGAAVIALAVPITGNEDEFLGLVVGMLGLDAPNLFHQTLADLHPASGGMLYLVDGQGRVIYHPDSRYIGANFQNYPVVRQVLTGQAGAMRTRSLDNLDIVAGFAPVPGTPWGLISQESWTGLTGSARRYQYLLLLLLGLGIVTPAFVLAIGLKRIMQPLEELISAAQEMAQGSFGRTIIARTGDEIEELARQFNLMSIQLEEFYTNLEQRVAERTRALAILNAIGASLNESLDLYERLDRILSETMELLEMEVGEIRLLDPDEEELVIRTEEGHSVHFLQQANRLKVADVLPAANIRTGEPLIEEDVFAQTTLSLARQEGLHAVAICPLRGTKQLLGTLSLATRRGPRPFSRNERELLRSIGDQAAVAIENAILHAETSQRVDEIEALFAVQQAITSRLDSEAVLQLIADEARRLTSSLGALVFLLAEDELQLSVLSSDDNLDACLGYCLSPTDSFIAPVIQSGQPLRLANVEIEPNLCPDLMERLQVHSLMTVPLVSGSEPMGAILVMNKISGSFDSDDQRVLTMLASAAVIGLENARLYEQAHQLAVMEERNRLARELHDSATQSLYAVTMFAEAASRLLRSNQAELAAENLAEVRQTAQEALQEMRLLIFELRPPILEKEGLITALQTRLEAVESRSGLKTEFQAEKIDGLPPHIEEGLYRIAQEALNNILKHARARRVAIQLYRQESNLVLEISDDGAGFDPHTLQAKGGLGLEGMAERARLLGGQLTIDSRPEQGPHRNLARAPQ